jgi:hypothetical protein
MGTTTTKETITFKAPEGFKDRIDDEIWNRKVEGNLDRDTSRSEFIRMTLESEISD